MRGIRRALVLTTGERYFSLVANFITLSIVSRLLTPDEIGVSVLGGAIAGTAMAFREFATPTFIIQRTHLSKDDVRTVATIQVFVSIATGAFIFLMSALLANIYHDTRVESFLRLAAFAIALEAIGITIAALLRRDMAFEKLAVINVASAATNTIVTLLLVWGGFSYMSFAWGWLASAGMSGLLSLLIWRDASIFKPSLRSLREVVEFCGINGLNITLGRLYDSVPYLVLGRILSVEAVALYNRSLTICVLPDKVFFGGVASAVLPAFSAHARDGGDLRRSYLRSVEFITAFQWPALAAICVLADPIVRLILGSQWLDAVPIIRIMALASFFTFSDQLTYPVLFAAGAMRDILKRAVIMWPSTAAVIVLAANFGLYAAALSWFVAFPLQALISNYYIRRHVYFSARELMLVLWRAALLSLSAVAGPLLMVALNGRGFDLSIGAMIVSMMLSAAGWLFALWAMQHPLLAEMRIMGQAVFSKIANRNASSATFSGLFGGQKIG
jgi:O-antigen/teichoic acid export membrane protein